MVLHASGRVDVCAWCVVRRRTQAAQQCLPAMYAVECLTCLFVTTLSFETVVRVRARRRCCVRQRFAHTLAPARRRIMHAPVPFSLFFFSLSLSRQVWDLLLMRQPRLPVTVMASIMTLLERALPFCLRGRAIVAPACLTLGCAALLPSLPCRGRLVRQAS